MKRTVVILCIGLILGLVHLANCDEVINVGSETIVADIAEAPADSVPGTELDAVKSEDGDSTSLEPGNRVSRQVFVGVGIPSPFYGPRYGGFYGPRYGGYYGRPYGGFYGGRRFIRRRRRFYG